MTIPKGVKAATQKLTDMLGELMPQFRNRLTANEQRIGIHLRGNQDLYEGLRELIESRIKGRAKLPEPRDPVVCKSMVARDRELQVILSTLEFIYKSPAVQLAEEEESEQPA